MLTFAVQKKPAAAISRRRSACPLVARHPALQAQQARVRQILRNPTIQRKLTLGAPHDRYEQEADRVAEQVMRMSGAEVTRSRPGSGRAVQAKFKDGGTIQRICTECEEEIARRQPLEEEEEELQAKPKSATSLSVPTGLESGTRSIKRGGQPLDPATRSFFEPRFGRDFGQVRLHTDQQAADIARSINARAFTLGNHVVLGAGEYQPTSRSGQRLLAHELTHVIQQGAGRTGGKEKSPESFASGPIDSVDTGQVIRRDLLDDLREMAEEAVKARLRELANQPIGAGGWTGADPSCPATFCQPFTSVRRAVTDLVWAGPLILAGIASKVNSRVVPLWTTYLAGGSGVQNLTSRFGTDFTASPTTRDTTRFLVGELRSLVEREHATLMGGRPRVTVDVSSNLLAARRAINTPGGPDVMNFDYPTDIAGNIAGGIGADQAAHRFGARPSPVNDSRTAAISATLERDASGTITVTPSIRFRVTDTIDLCPGNCGTTDEQVATVPLSRFEATNLVGDVPFNIDFDAPAAELAAFTITPAAPSPAPVRGEVTASALRYRAVPDLSAAILGRYPRGTSVELQCRTTGSVVLGVDTWYRTADGFVSGRYVSLTGGGTPPAC